jgi:hypothetical protein
MIFFPLLHVLPAPRRWLGALLPLVLGAACATGGATEAGSSGDAGGSNGANPSGSRGSAIAESNADIGGPAELDALLSEWADRLDAEEGEKRDESYRTVARMRSNSATPEQTLWTLAMVHLLPGSPHFDRDRGREHLAALEEHFPGAPEAVQASVLRQLFRELDRTAAEAQEGDRLVEELSRTVEEFREAMEQLKRIDLNRRPVRDTRGDTIRSRAPAGPGVR